MAASVMEPALAMRKLCFFLLALEFFNLRGGGVVLLLQLINDIDQIKTAEMRQFFVHHFFLVLPLKGTIGSRSSVGQHDLLLETIVQPAVPTAF